MTLSLEAIVLIVTIITVIFPGGIYVGRLAQRVDHLEKAHSDIIFELREIRKLLTETSDES